MNSVEFAVFASN